MKHYLLKDFASLFVHFMREIEIEREREKREFLVFEWKTPVNQHKFKLPFVEISEHMAIDSISFITKNGGS